MKEREEEPDGEGRALAEAWKVEKAVRGLENLGPEGRGPRVLLLQVAL